MVIGLVCPNQQLHDSPYGVSTSKNKTFYYIFFSGRNIASLNKLIAYCICGVEISIDCNQRSNPAQLTADSEYRLPISINLSEINQYGLQSQKASDIYADSKHMKFSETSNNNLRGIYTVASKKVRLFYFIRFFQNNLVKIELYFFKKKSINIRFNIIFGALFNDILLDKYNLILTKLFEKKSKKIQVLVFCSPL